MYYICSRFSINTKYFKCISYMLTIYMLLYGAKSQNKINTKYKHELLTWAESLEIYYVSVSLRQHFVIIRTNDY